MSRATADKVRFEDATVYVRVIGPGKGEPLLLVNGLGAHTAMWRPLEKTLEAAGRRIIEFDLPGAGRSDVPWRPPSVARLARLSTAVLDRFDVERADVLGYSMGGIVAQQLAVDYPSRVRRLVLVATTPGLGSVQGDKKALLNIMTPIRYLSPRLYGWSIGSLAGGRARTDAAWVAEQGTLRLRYAPSWRGYAGQLLTMSGWSSLPRLAEIEHPVLVLAGDDDPLTPVVNGMMIAHLLPRGRLRVLQGDGHLMVLDEQSESHGLLREFLSADELEGTPAWDDASEVTADELRAALASSGFQLPPLSLISSFMRRRWLGGSGLAA